MEVEAVEPLESNDEQKKCLICNKLIEDPQGGAISIFKKTTQTCSDRPLNFIMSQVLAQNIDRTNVHSDLICTACFKTFDEVDELERKLQQQKIQLINKYKKSLKLASTQDEANSSKDETQEDIFIETSAETVIDMNDDKIDITPKALGSIEDIEDQLVKMHGGELDDDKDNADQFDEMNSKPTEELSIQLEVNARDLCAPKEKSKIIYKRENNDEDKSQLVGLNETMDDDDNDEMKIDKCEESNTMMVARNGNLYTCMLCEGDETVCGEHRAIAEHIIVVHKKFIYFCDICGLDFHRKVELQGHLNSHSSQEDSDFQCEVCNRIYNGYRLFQVHKRVHCSTLKTWKCSTCEKAFSSQKILEDHMNFHTGIRPYACEICHKTFASKYTFKNHEKTHVPRLRQFFCKECDKSFLTAKNLAQHEKVHVGKDFTCHLCKKHFATLSNLEIHSVVHSGYRPFVCGLCGKSFARKAEIRDHERTHTGERPYQCDICGSTFSQRSNLQSHKRATHYHDKRYKCSQCGKGFKRRRLLDYHTKSAHTGERPFKCNICNATFVYPEHFKKHRRIHTGEKPYKCEVCGKAFNNRDNRNAHRFVHSDKKPYECMVCGAGFMRKPLVYAHMQHEGHPNDAIIVNQPHLSGDSDALVMFTTKGEMEIMQDSMEEEESQETKVYFSEPIVISNKADNELILGDNGDEANVEHIIVDEESKHGEENEVEVEEETILANVEDLQGILTPEAIASGHTQIIQTKDGPIRLLAVKITNEKGEEEETWIKILPDPE